MAEVSKNTMLSLQQSCNGMGTISVLSKLASEFPKSVTFSTSFGMEDQVITDMISKSGSPISIFTLDTGRLFSETYSVWSRTLEQYGLKIKAYHPDKKQLQVYTSEFGPNAFYESTSLRKSCCQIRKVIPLKKALENKSIWITGLRAEHSPERSAVDPFEWDDVHQVVKYHPLLYWTTAEVREYINKHQVPYNSLHDKGFVSIGCAPCTRAIVEGEDFRAGRWWWEGKEGKECGLHVGISNKEQGF